MAGGSAQHLAQRRHRPAEHADRGPLCARVRLRNLRWHRRDRRLGRGGAVKGWARPDDGRARIRTGYGWFGHGVFLWYVGSVAASSAAADWRPAGTLRRRMGGRADASRRPAGPASAAGSGPGRTLSRWLCGRHRRVHASRTACGVRAAALCRDDRRLHQAASGPTTPRHRCRWHSSCHRCRRARILVRQRPSGTGTVGRDAALRASWAPTIMMTAPMRIAPPVAPGSWPL